MRGKWITYTKTELAWVSDNRTMVISDLHIAFCKKFSRTDVTAENLNSLRKRKGWRTGRTGQFKKGNIPHPNSGSRGPNKGTFKRGHRPHNWVPIRTERPTTDGYLRVKVAEPNIWEFKHLQVWEAHHGPIPESHVVTFADNNPLNCDPENLLLLTRAEHAVINKMRLSRVPADMKESVRLIAQIKIKTTERMEE